MTYGCLLRPHREIRELTWSDFSDDLTYIHLSENRNKSGRNRIVPVPTYVRAILLKISIAPECLNEYNVCPCSSRLDCLLKLLQRVLK